MAQQVVAEERELDEIMLAMDVVDTLRHEKLMLEQDLDTESRRQDLIGRLREIYKNQGIEVPDRILLEGVKALEEERFVYKPYKGGFFAKAYINRKYWGLPLVFFGLFLSALFAGNYLFVEVPKAQRAAKIERLLNTDLPKEIEQIYQKGTAIAKGGFAKQKITGLYQDAKAAIEARDIKSVNELKQKMAETINDINAEYVLRIVSRPGENSGVFRINDAAANIRNYYLIVEGINSAGKPVSVLIESEEDKKTARTKIWGVRVPQRVYQKVAADKRDDQIIQNDIIGKKQRGFLKPKYNIETSGGLILEW